MDQTDVWMLGVGAFGIVFYLFSVYYHRKSGGGHEAGDTTAPTRH